VNILGIMGSIGYDGNIPYHVGDIGDFWSHGSGATLIMDGKLKTAINEERFSRIKYDGQYPKLAIQHILDHNNLTKHDIDLVVFVTSGTFIAFELKKSGYIKSKLQEYFPNSTVEYVSHHMAHTAATFFTSGFDEANILSFDGAGDPELQTNGRWLTPHMKFTQGKGGVLTEVFSCHCLEPPMSTGFGILYDIYSHQVYKNKMIQLNKDSYRFEKNEKNLDPRNRETYPGKVMGLSAYGDYKKIDLPEWFTIEKGRQKYSNNEWEDCVPILINNLIPNIPSEEYVNLDPDDLAAWLQHQFEKYLLLFLSNIPKNIKLDNLCLGGGSALNILTNSKIIEQGIYKNVHVNTAPNDDGLHFGAALYKCIEKEQKLILPEDIGYLGITYTDEEIEAVL
tara:strand:+ start:572 stop:1753 length:1182 start_codon:yes stop_codon:yes gene_type:complete